MKSNDSLDLIIEKVLDIALYWKAEAEKAKEELKNQQVYETKRKIAELDKEIERLRDAPIEKPYFPSTKIIWKPTKFGAYYTFGRECGELWKVVPSFWTDHPNDFTRFNIGWMYRTEEAAKAALPIVAKELGVEYSV